MLEHWLSVADLRIPPTNMCVRAPPNVCSIIQDLKSSLRHTSDGLVKLGTAMSSASTLTHKLLAHHPAPTPPPA